MAFLVIPLTSLKVQKHFFRTLKGRLSVKDIVPKVPVALKLAWPFLIKNENEVNYNESIISTIEFVMVEKNSKP